MAEREAEETRRRNVLRIEVEGAKAAAKRAAQDLQREKESVHADEAAFKSEVSIPLGESHFPPGESKTIRGEPAGSEVRMASEVTMASGATAEDFAEEGDNCWRRRMAARTLQSGNSFSLARYRSVRDHNGRYYLVVKVR